MKLIALEEEEQRYLAEVLSKLSQIEIIEKEQLSKLSQIEIIEKEQLAHPASERWREAQAEIERMRRLFPDSEEEAEEDVREVMSKLRSHFDPYDLLDLLDKIIEVCRHASMLRSLLSTLLSMPDDIERFITHDTSNFFTIYQDSTIMEECAQFRENIFSDYLFDWSKNCTVTCLHVSHCVAFEEGVASAEAISKYITQSETVIDEGGVLRRAKSGEVRRVRTTLTSTRYTTDTFRFIGDYENCISRANITRQKVLCNLGFVLGLIELIADQFKKLIPFTK